jgi:catechol 2,3-dioxygenase-like lactoylglutathione lyase family enzyme
MKYRWDGGFIMASWDQFEEGVEWYTKHFGWQCLDQIISSVGKKAFLKMPHSGVVTLKSFESKLEHFQPGSGQEGNARLCFEIGNIEDCLQYFEQHQIRVADMVTLPTGEQSFDLYGFEGARITVVHNPEHDGKYPDSRIIGFGKVNMRLGVTDIKRAIEWYQQYFGFTLVKDASSEGYAHMQVEDAYYHHTLHQTLLDNIWLEEVAAEQAGFEGDPFVRTYFDIRPEHFETLYGRLVEQGLKPSEVAGDPLTGWGGFHLFDPDGNRINVWSYQLYG